MAWRLTLLRLSILLVCVDIALADRAQVPLRTVSQDSFNTGQDSSSRNRPLTGRFLHITDLHPDPFYVVGSNAKDGACHEGKGSAGPFGAEITDCDSPMSLINATFEWLERNLKDSVDFVVWTGDSARHDNDENIPRTEKQVRGENEILAEKMWEVFGKDKDSHGRSRVPVIPNIGNNDVMPHNIFFDGPNSWTRTYSKIWKHFVPEEQRHSFEQGGWFYVEVIPSKLAVFSLNTLYFFDRNAVVDGCSDSAEPGFAQMQWLRIQLQFMRERGMKAILTGHVPPARVPDEKISWTESCWQKYTLWVRQYRDVIVSSMYGHMNIEHFVLQDFKDIDIAAAAEYSGSSRSPQPRKLDPSEDRFSIASHRSYLLSLRNIWSHLPDVPLDILTGATEAETHSKKKLDLKKFDKKIGGYWGERYSLSYVSASVVPNYFPSMRVFEYNITGLDSSSIEEPGTWYMEDQPSGSVLQHLEFDELDGIENLRDLDDKADSEMRGLKRKKKKKGKKKKKPKFTVPLPPSKSAPPGPAYSPQALSLTGYKQYYANLTKLNKHPNGLDNQKKQELEYEIAFDTRDKDDVYELHDGLFMRRMIHLASRIGEYKSNHAAVDSLGAVNEDEKGETEVDAESERGLDDQEQGPLAIDMQGYDAEAVKHKKKKKKKKKKDDAKRRRIIKDTWYAFCRRAVVGTMTDADLDDQFGNGDD